MSRPLRIAYLGPAPRAHGGVAGIAGQVLPGLLDLGHEIDCYLARLESPLPENLQEHPSFTLINQESAFRYGAWYSRTELTKLAVGQTTRALAERRLAHELSRRHTSAPYDVVYQVSHIELFGLNGALLPTLVVHPHVHAAGELRWLLRERDIGRRCEPLHRRIAARTLLASRTQVQRRHARAPAGFICLSRAFQRAFCSDCEVDESLTRVVPNPIDLDAFRPAANGTRRSGPIKILFIGRISVRKGVECIVELSHRLDDRAGSVEIEVVGDRTQWSDYRRLLADLNPRVATYRGGVAPDEMPQLVAGADLLVQPSKYEPFGLTVGEALASGVPVVATDEVGAAEDVSPECLSVVPVGDMPALEAAVRLRIEQIERGEGPRLAAIARAEAERLFEPGLVAGSIATALQELVA